MSKSEDHHPTWLDAENDQSHKDEIAPLFGTGSLSLLDTEEDQSDVEQGESSKYGSIVDDDDKYVAAPSKATNVSSSWSKKNKVSKIVITETGKPEVPHRNCLLTGFVFIEGFGVLTSLCLLTAQLVPLFVIRPKYLDVMSVVLKVYISLFCVLFVLIEWDIPIVRNANFLQNYLSRGFLYSFIASSCLEEAFSELVKDMAAHSREQFHIAWFSLFMQVSSWMMLCLGAVYMLLGLCCLKGVRDKMVKKDRERWETYYEAMELYRSENP